MIQMWHRLFYRHGPTNQAPAWFAFLIVIVVPLVVLAAWVWMWLNG